MSVIFILVIAGLIIALGFLIAFIWAVKSGQYDDRETPAMRILFDDSVRHHNKNNKSEKS
ncbi:MAG: cbb3-type cytochrome oxidase assembly protein CcoS [FCB group bacterium]|nr:cbb3-type cytochrome oxidase assembly protein CcoS [FCB group bacterium]